VLTSDIQVLTAGATAISIGTSPVDLDLNHHTVDGGGSCAGTPASTCGGGNGLVGIGQSNGGKPGILHLHDGTIKGFTYSPGIPSAIYMNDAGDGTVLERFNVTEIGGNGAINIKSSAAGVVRLRDCQISRNDNYGVSKVGGSAAFMLSLENCDVSGNGAFGIAGFDGIFSGNRFTNNGNYAINAIGLKVALGENAFVGNNSGGVQYNIGTVLNLGSNVCFDHACP
jgi:hypothetical protein